MEPILEARNLIKIYKNAGAAVRALRGIDIQVEPGEFIVVTGKSGSGKTTLVNMITALDRITEGEVWVAGTPIHNLNLAQGSRWRGENVGIIFQSFELLPTLTVLQNVMLPMDFAGKYTPRQRRKRALSLLDQVGIVEHAHKVPGAVSGGQRQRVAIARALANEPKLLVADEPTGSLDSKTAAAVMDLFEEARARDTTVILVTHDPDIATRGTRAAELVDGKLV
jgi:putative ABC transport system ATP-binding protein